MKVLLIKDVYKLGRAGDVKRVADGYGRNYLLPKGLAVLATGNALKQVEAIRANAAVQRQALNEEMSGVAELLEGKVFVFASKAGETGKLYGSITTQMIADAIKEKHEVEIDRHQIEVNPVRMLGEHKARVRLTVDLVPEITIIVHREGEALAAEETSEEPTEEVAAETPVETTTEEVTAETPVETTTEEAAEVPAEETTEETVSEDNEETQE